MNPNQPKSITKDPHRVRVIPSTSLYSDGTYLGYFTATQFIMDPRPITAKVFDSAYGAKSPLMKVEILHGEIVDFEIFTPAKIEKENDHEADD